MHNQYATKQALTEHFERQIANEAIDDPRVAAMSDRAFEAWIKTEGQRRADNVPAEDVVPLRDVLRESNVSIEWARHTFLSGNIDMPLFKHPAYPGQRCMLRKHARALVQMRRRHLARLKQEAIMA